jgi:protein tyrosine phosphatase (PTP) superfamily phosphohydrolase (DUF442 family)
LQWRPAGAAHLAELKAQGVTTVINLRVVGEARFDAPAEEDDVKKLGMKYSYSGSGSGAEG